MTMLVFMRMMKLMMISDDADDDDDDAGCEFGDKASWCPNYVTSNRDCYSESEICCQSCEKYRVNITGFRSTPRSFIFHLPQPALCRSFLSAENYRESQFAKLLHRLRSTYIRLYSLYFLFPLLST